MTPRALTLLVCGFVPAIATGAGQTSANYRIAADSFEGAGNLYAAPMASSTNYAQSFSITQ